MRLIAVSVLSVFTVLPAFAAARLPVVNLSAGAVSARAAFGDIKSVQNYGTPVADMYGTDATSDVTVAPVPKKVVTRAAVPTPKQNIAADTGAQIATRGEVLIPRKPSANLWARSDVPLRMPTPDEFAVIRSDNNALPEESLNTFAATVAARPAIIEQADVPSAVPMSQIDAQIAHFTELQRRADESFGKSAHENVTVAKADTIASYNMSANVASNVSTQSGRAVVGHVPAAASESKPAPVKLSRLVVPSDDVVVRAVEKTQSSQVAAVRNDMANLNPAELRRAFRKTFLSENKHLSTYPIDNRFDVASDMSSSIEGFTARRDLSEGGGIRPLEIKIRFRNDDSALSRDNYTLLTEYAGVVLSNPTRAIQVSIPQSATVKSDDRKLAARRLAIVEQVLRDTGISEQRILPVLSQRDEDAFVLRIISSDQYETMTQQQKNVFGDTVSKKTYKSMSW